MLACTVKKCQYKIYSISKVLKLSYRSIIRHLIAKVLYYDYKIGIILNFSIRLHYTSDMCCHRTVL